MPLRGTASVRPASGQHRGRPAPGAAAGETRGAERMSTSRWRPRLRLQSEGPSYQPRGVRAGDPLGLPPPTPAHGGQAGGLLTTGM